MNFEQARQVQTVKVHTRTAKSYVDQTVGCLQGWPCKVIAIDWVTCRLTWVKCLRVLYLSWLNVQSGYHKPPRRVVLVWSGGLKIEAWEAQAGSLPGKGIQLRLRLVEQWYAKVRVIAYHDKEVEGWKRQIFRLFFIFQQVDATPL